MAVDKKISERKIIDQVYPAGWFSELIPSERPDFLARRFSGGPQFGIEVTEFFHTESEARLRHRSGYGSNLLNGGEYIHKDDAIHLEVAKVDILTETNEVKQKDVSAIIHEMPSLAECGRLMGEAITRKASVAKACPSSLTHVNLLIRDYANQTHIPSKDHYAAYFTAELRNAIARSPFREITLITGAREGRVYFHLKMILLISEFQMFGGTAREFGVGKSVDTIEDCLEIFAAYFTHSVSRDIFLHGSGDDTEVIYGDTGLMLRKDSIALRLHSDHLFPTDMRAAKLDRADVLGSDFSVKVDDFRKRNTFVSELHFPCE